MISIDIFLFCEYSMIFLKNSKEVTPHPHAGVHELCEITARIFDFDIESISLLYDDQSIYFINYRSFVNLVPKLLKSTKKFLNYAIIHHSVLIERLN